MSEFRYESYVMPAAALGSCNPLPALRRTGDAHAAIASDPSIPDDERRHLGYGCGPRVLPYLMQDAYDRNRAPRAFEAAILENETLRAVFLPELGGRLWSLVHKPTDRELLYRNPVFQPGNLAIRNAWFSGGVEWNIGIVGHCPFTCSPLHAARLTAPDGTPVLRLYEWERIRGAPFQIDAWLPAGASMLFVRVHILNPHDTEIPMYWWSNIAAPETPDTRVLVPADAARRFGYEGRLTSVAIPAHQGADVTFPARIGPSMDFFYRLPEGQRPWIAALDGAGRGLVQTSTARLRGRKLFVWGMNAGGRRWQEFLSLPGAPYIEIQAGLGRTQMECVPMPAYAAWDWLEAYGPMDADPGITHGPDWPAARREVKRRLDEMLPEAALASADAMGAVIAARPPEAWLCRGSGWGALERRRRERSGEPPFLPAALPFHDATLGDDQAPWLALLETGNFPEGDPDGPDPGAWMVQTEWRALLEAAVKKPDNAHWRTWLHLGVMRFDAGDDEGARRAWQQSLQHRRSPWALRNLALLEQMAGRKAEAADLWMEAHQRLPGMAPLAIECGQALIEAGRSDDWLDLLPKLPDPIRRRGRTRLLEARAAMESGDLERVETMLHDAFVVEDIREGEISLSDLWTELHARRLAARASKPPDETFREQSRRDFPPPAHLDFRMRPDIT